jgi:uncharacterized membrane protein YozB (DUF420 family)
MSVENQNRLARSVLKWAVILLLLKTVIQIVSSYRDYLPPNFKDEFLLGRDHYFFGWYQCAFYSHIVFSPISILLGLILVSNQFRQRYAVYHRRLGRLQIGIVLLFVVPSGIAMSLRTLPELDQHAKIISGFGFASLGFATGFCALMGWLRALQRNFASHRRWMWRLFLLLCSAIVLRLMAGAASLANLDLPWLYPFSAWASWLVPLTIGECFDASKRPQLTGLQVVEQQPKSSTSP